MNIIQSILLNLLYLMCNLFEHLILKTGSIHICILALTSPNTMYFRIYMFRAWVVYNKDLIASLWVRPVTLVFGKRENDSRDYLESETVHWRVISCITWVTPLPRPFVRLAVGTPESIHSHDRFLPPEVTKVSNVTIFTSYVSSKHSDTKIAFFSKGQSGEN